MSRKEKSILWCSEKAFIFSHFLLFLLSTFFSSPLFSLFTTNINLFSCVFLLRRSTDVADRASYSSGPFAKGLIQTGAWAIFYDFNSIESSVLSVIAQQISTIRRAKAERSIKVVLQGTTLKLDASCNIFATVNPDYPGGFLRAVCSMAIGMSLHLY